MLSVLARSVPLSEKGALVYFYEDGHNRFSLSCLHRTQKRDESHLDAHENAFIKGHLGRVAKCLHMDKTHGEPYILSWLIFSILVGMFGLMIALVIMSDDFLSVSYFASGFEKWVFGTVILGALLLLVVSFRYYQIINTHIDMKQGEIKMIIDELNRDKNMGFQWEIGERSLWFRVLRNDINFVNKPPNFTEDDLLEGDDDHHGHGHDSHGHGDDSHGHGHSNHHGGSHGTSHGPTHGTKSDNAHGSTHQAKPHVSHGASHGASQSGSQAATHATPSEATHNAPHGDPAHPPKPSTPSTQPDHSATH
jgi:hypothetical protein